MSHRPSRKGRGGRAGGGQDPATNTGRWTKEEHEAFIEGLKQFGREWKHVAHYVPSRTVVQIRTHAQKYFQKLAKEHGHEAAERAFQGASDAPAANMGSVAADKTRRFQELLRNPPPPTPEEPAEEGALPGVGIRRPARPEGPAGTAFQEREGSKSRNPPARKRARGEAARATRSTRSAGRPPLPTIKADDSPTFPDRSRHLRSRASSLASAVAPTELDLAIRRPDGVSPPASTSPLHPVTPSTIQAAMSLVKNKTYSNLADGKRTPRTVSTAAWLKGVQQTVATAAARGMRLPSHPASNPENPPLPEDSPQSPPVVSQRPSAQPGSLLMTAPATRAGPATYPPNPNGGGAGSAAAHEQLVRLHQQQFGITIPDQARQFHARIQARMQQRQQQQQATPGPGQPVAPRRSLPHRAPVVPRSSSASSSDMPPAKPSAESGAGAGAAAATSTDATAAPSTAAAAPPAVGGVYTVPASSGEPSDGGTQEASAPAQ